MPTDVGAVSGAEGAGGAGDADEDYKVGFQILGWLQGRVASKEFPLQVRDIEVHFNDQEIVDSFTVITATGLRYTVTCAFAGRSETDEQAERNEKDDGSGSSAC